MSHLSDLRKSYERAELDETASLSDPLQQFGCGSSRRSTRSCPSRTR
jgi:hypothetical protein